MSKVSKKEILKDLKKYKSIEAILDLDGGKELIKLLEVDVTTAVDTIAGNYKELTHTEFIAQGARLSERLSLYRLLKGAKKNADIVLEALKEAEEDTD